MNDWHAGDIKDFLKYALLRRFHQDCGFSIAVCWMMTPRFNHSTVPRHEDRKYDYLRKDKWKFLDEMLFLRLHRLVLEENRISVKEFQRSGFIPAKVFHDDYLPSDVEQRDSYFEAFFTKSEDCDLIFFDPDTGLSPDHSSSLEHLSYIETFMAHALRKSVLIFQYYERKNRGSIIKEKVGRLQSEIKDVKIAAYETPHVLFLLLVQPQHIQAVEVMNRKMERDWNEKKSPSRSRVLAIHEIYER